MEVAYDYHSLLRAVGVRYSIPYSNTQLVHVWGCCRIYVYGRVYLRLMLCVPRGILGITMECRCGQYSVANCRNVGAMFPPSIFKDRCVDLRRSMSTFEDRRSMCRPSRIDDRCVDLRRNNHIDHPSKMDDRCADLRRSMAVVSTLKTDDRCEIMLLHLLKTLMV